MQTTINPKITDAEWEIMRVIWANEPATSRYISKVLSEKMDWKPATSKTLLGRLVEKGIVSTASEGNKFLYSAKTTEEESIRQVTENVLSQVCDKKVGATIASLLSQAILSKEDIRLLEEVLQAKKVEALEEVPCTCVPGQCECNHQSKSFIE